MMKRIIIGYGAQISATNEDPIETNVELVPAIEKQNETNWTGKIPTIARNITMNPHEIPNTAVNTPIAICQFELKTKAKRTPAMAEIKKMIMKLYQGPIKAFNTLEQAYAIIWAIPLASMTR